MCDRDHRKADSCDALHHGECIADRLVAMQALHSEDDARELVIEMQRRTSLDPRGKAM